VVRLDHDHDLKSQGDRHGRPWSSSRAMAASR
jgi:hypothetical protein